jgi:glycerate kinase
MKGSVDAVGFANAVEEGLNEAGIMDVIKLPLADGGDGTAKILATYYKADVVPVKVNDPLNREIESVFYINKCNTAILEMADASGLKLLDPSEYSAINTTSFGTGQLIKAAVESGATTIIIGVGGSATVDGGMGALMALGVRFFSSENEILVGNGSNTGDVIYIDSTAARKVFDGINLIFLSDVTNPLLGQEGAARIFGPQKGATHLEVEMLEKNLSLYAGALFQTTGIDISKLPGGGAAGGIVASFHALFNAQPVNGAVFILEKAGFLKLALDADVIVTGEGAIDDSTFMGKAPGEVLRIGIELGKPVYAICGSNKLTQNSGFTEIFSLLDERVDESTAIKEAYTLIKHRTLLMTKK